MALSAPDAAPSVPDFSEVLLYDLLAVSLTAVNILHPVYGPIGELTDFAIDYLYPAG